MDYDELIKFLFEISDEAMQLGKKYPDDVNTDCMVSSDNLDKFNDHYFKLYEFANKHSKIEDNQ